MLSQLLQEYFEKEMQDNVTEKTFLSFFKYQFVLWFVFIGVLSFNNGFHLTFECLQESN